MSRSRDFRVGRDLIDTIRDLKRPGLGPQTGWRAVGASGTDGGVPFGAAWGNAGVVAGVTNAPASWHLSDDGEVRLRGTVDGGSPGSTIFTLPEENCPEFAESFACPMEGGGFAKVTVHADGRVTLDSIG